MSLLIRHWLEEDLYLLWPELGWDRGCFTAALEQLYRLELAGDLTLMNAITNAADGGIQTIAKVAIKRLIKQIRSGPIALDSPDWYNISIQTSFIHHLSNKSSVATQSLLYQGLVAAIVKCVYALPREIPHHESEIPSPLGHCVVNIFKIMNSIVTIANGPAKISQALDVGLVQAILKGGLWLQRLKSTVSGMDYIASRQLFGHLRQYLVYRSVLRSVQTTLKQVEDLNIDPAGTGAFFEDYIRFRGAAKNRLVVKGLSDQIAGKGDNPGFLGCERKDVGQRYILKHLYHDADGILYT